MSDKKIVYGILENNDLENLRKSKFDRDSANVAMNRMDFPSGMNERLISLFYKAALEKYTDANYAMQQNEYKIRYFFKIDANQDISINFDNGEVYAIEKVDDETEVKSGN